LAEAGGSMDGPDFAALRRTMVDCQIRPADVTDYRVLAAMMWAPREMFLPSRLRPVAYADRDFALPEGEVVLAPRTLAKMLQVAGVRSDDIVLDIGCAGGYSAAVVSRLAEAVVALERDSRRVDRATAQLAAAGVVNCAVLEGDLVVGDPAHGPYDVILVQGGVERMPNALCRQLKENGRLVAIRVCGPGGECRVVQRCGEAFAERGVFDAVAPRLQAFARRAEFAF